MKKKNSEKPKAQDLIDNVALAQSMCEIYECDLPDGNGKIVKGAMLCFITLEPVQVSSTQSSHMVFFFVGGELRAIHYANDMIAATQAMTHVFSVDIEDNPIYQI